MDAARKLVLPADNGRPDFETGEIFFIGTATVLLRYAGLTILTDPNFLHQGDWADWLMLKAAWALSSPSS